MRAPPTGRKRIALTRVAATVIALALALLKPMSAAAAAQPGVGVNSSGIRAETTPLNIAPRIRGAAIREPRSPQPPREPAAGTLLIAHHKLRDPNFVRSVVLLAEYSAEGALGLILNRPTPVPLAEALAGIERLRGRPQRLYAGGPVQRNRIFLLIESQQADPDALPISGNLYLSGKAAALERLLDGSNPEQTFRAYAGYAGWGPGQLDGELDRGDWQLWWSDRETVFSDDDVGLWQRLIRESTQRWVRRHRNLETWVQGSGPSAVPVAVFAKLAAMRNARIHDAHERVPTFDQGSSELFARSRRSLLRAADKARGARLAQCQ